MIRICVYYKCKNCHDIAESAEWESSTFKETSPNQFVQEISLQCPTCKHKEYEIVEYDQLPTSFKNRMTLESIEDHLIVILKELEELKKRIG